MVASFEAPSTPKALNTKLTSLTGCHLHVTEAFTLWKDERKVFCLVEKLVSKYQVSNEFEKLENKRTMWSRAKVRMKIVNYEKLKKLIEGIYKS